jgi:hypothetical protein
MAKWLSGSRKAVVAAYARPLYYSLVGLVPEVVRVPGGGRMARIAVGGGWNMGYRLPRGKSARPVAGSAFPWRSAESCLDMAGLAAFTEMGATEDEARSGMVERR